MYSPAGAQITTPDRFPHGDLSILSSGSIKKATAPVTLGQTPLGGSPGLRTSLSAEDNARFALEWPKAVSLGWDEVMHLLESCCPDPNTQQMLRTLASD